MNPEDHEDFEGDDCDIVIVEFGPVVDLLTEILAVLERMNYHMEERWGVHSEKTHS